MKLKLCAFMILILCLTAAPSLAQETSGQECDSDSIADAMNGVIASYLQAQGGADDTSGALEAVQGLYDSAGELLDNCANATAETTPAAESTSGETAGITEGKYMINWGRSEQTCSDGSGVSGLNRPIILHLEGDKVITEDVFYWPRLEFAKDADGVYFYRRNVTLDDGSTLSFEYRFDTLSPDLIEGTTTNFFQNINCVLTNNFQLVLVDANTVCMVGSETGANLRSGPGTTFDRLGALNAGEPADVIGQATGSDGFVWWQLTNEAWVRSDLVEEAGTCEGVPTVAT